ncbi:MAG: hypothetical protein Q9211_000394 [Gyalolechia sp. 1 TL-2023]
MMSQIAAQQNEPGSGSVIDSSPDPDRLEQRSKKEHYDLSSTQKSDYVQTLTELECGKSQEITNETSQSLCLMTEYDIFANRARALVKERRTSKREEVNSDV